MIKATRLVKSSLTALMTCCVVAALALPGQAGWRRSNRPQYDRAAVDGLIHQVENRSDVFVEVFRRSLDNVPMDETRRQQERWDERAAALKRTVNAVRTAFERSHNQNDIRLSVGNAISIASGINKLLRNRQLDPVVEGEWSLLHSDLNELAALYHVRQLA